tara:strand:- start:1020 stop:1604 length:585 start_codon:yes stop_codon:yes gene_type:complete
MSLLSLKKLEIVKIDLNYDQIRLLEYYNTLKHENINDIKLTHSDKFETIRDLKKHMIASSHEEVNIRKDLVSNCDKDHPLIKEILDQLKKKLNYHEFGSITFFLQKAGEDVPLHGDWPYRKNSLLIIPIIVSPYYTQSKAITYYKDGGEYTINQPTIMDVMPPHGVKNIDKDRLMLHIEIPNLTIEEVNDRIGI